MWGKSNPNRMKMKIFHAIYTCIKGGEESEWDRETIHFNAVDVSGKNSISLTILIWNANERMKKKKNIRKIQQQKHLQ